MIPSCFNDTSQVADIKQKAHDKEREHLRAIRPTPQSARCSVNSVGHLLMVVVYCLALAGGILHFCKSHVSHMTQ
jgi:hypothetical protein